MLWRRVPAASASQAGGHCRSTECPSYQCAAPPQTPATVSLADEEAVRRILVDTLFGLWATVNNLTRLRPSRHERYRVTVFGSARTEPEHWVYAEVKQMCSALSAMDCDIITGGGPGLMQAANEGAKVAQAGQGVQSLGIRVHLPFEQEQTRLCSKRSSTQPSLRDCITSCSCQMHTSFHQAV
jgi:hypothetical protein